MNDRPTAIVLEKTAWNLDSLVSSAALDRLRRTLLVEWQSRDAFADVSQFGIGPTSTAVFYGPPGNGKTMAAKMLASAIDVPLYRVACESLIASLLGESERNMRDVLDWLEKQPDAVVLFDECETVFRRRGKDTGGSCGQAIVRAMQVFWQRLDTWDSPQLFLMATNRIDDVDAALLSRIELQLEFEPPTKTQATAVVAYWAETLHEYGSEVWQKTLLDEFKRGPLPVSFRALWQSISNSVREFILSS